MADAPRIILTSPGGKTGELVAGSLRGHGLDVHILEGPSARKDFHGFVRSLDKEVRGNGADMIMPVFFPEALAACRDRFPGICIPLDDEKKILLLDNKASCCDLVAELEIPQPRRFASPDEVGCYPAVFKRPFGQGGDSVYFPRSAEALQHLLGNSSEYIISELIEGYDECVDALRWGDYFFAASYRVLESRGKGVSTKRESISAPLLEGYARKILDAIDFQGVCGFDFRIDAATGKAYFLECNPRFSGGLETTIASGFDLPYTYYRLASSGKYGGYSRRIKSVTDL